MFDLKSNAAMHNPLKRSILNILKEAQEPLKEYDLHSTLGGCAFAHYVKHCSADLVLFRKHFLVMNALYTLHDELLPQGLYLHISALEIQLKKINPTKAKSQALNTDISFQKLSRYYQNWQHFEQTNDKDVSSLLQQFWAKFLASEEKQQSLACLGLVKKISKNLLRTLAGLISRKDINIYASGTTLIKAVISSILLKFVRLMITLNVCNYSA
ncbi:MAG: hypothetical protein KZQ74_11815 [gamma proteobacterium symbiont of Bathyaustriella thionipta]|nr:hypothetical protein [gamma proteobacterium symbiont of Bathyaustriella thionipta]MCU7951709.1 hypothetical protein [gamma proteobacterium symbiont of Bathyaustriella thionipta]MCU7958312.1 hypothetical protein [gamma proteobacterium symbiont of Bathyaustriella thionipta]MCU7967861.1 hypothetical protein [gamma proteobacterium symbiont of Bathyaustriella thionipta]